jgi:hypothetical protein
MDASEYALRDASYSPFQRDARIANTVLQDSRSYRIWESRHADLLVPVARHNGSKPLLLELRNAQVKLIHRRALFRYLRINEVRGEKRQRLFSHLHNTLDYRDAVVAEHRQYMLAVSSRISADYIIGIMNDANSPKLLEQYEELYARYFEIKCYIATTREKSCIDMARPILKSIEGQLCRVRHRIETEAPVGGVRGFDRQEAIARSGRYEALNYLVS